MVKMRISDGMPEHQRKRFGYRTRMMTADGSIEMAPRDAQFFRLMGWAEEAAEVPAPEPTQAELRKQAEDLGIKMPTGYVRKDVLAEMIATAAQAPSEAAAEDDEVGDA